MLFQRCPVVHFETFGILVIFFELGVGANEVCFVDNCVLSFLLELLRVLEQVVLLTRIEALRVELVVVVRFRVHVDPGESIVVLQVVRLILEPEFFRVPFAVDLE